MSTLVSVTLIPPSPTHTHTHTCSLMYWMQSLPVFSWSTTMASMLRPSTLVIATVYLRGGFGHENMQKQKQTNKQNKVDMNHLPPVDWFTQVNQTAILNMKTNETNQYIYTWVHIADWGNCTVTYNTDLSLLFYTTLTQKLAIHNLIHRCFPFSKYLETKLAIYIAHVILLKCAMPYHSRVEALKVFQDLCLFLRTRAFLCVHLGSRKQSASILQQMYIHTVCNLTLASLSFSWTFSKASFNSR